MYLCLMFEMYMGVGALMCPYRPFADAIKTLLLLLSKECQIVSRFYLEERSLCYRQNEIGVGILVQPVKDKLGVKLSDVHEGKKCVYMGSLIF